LRLPRSSSCNRISRCTLSPFPLRFPFPLFIRRGRAFFFPSGSLSSRSSETLPFPFLCVFETPFLRRKDPFPFELYSGLVIPQTFLFYLGLLLSSPGFSDAFSFLAPSLSSRLIWRVLFISSVQLSLFFHSKEDSSPQMRISRGIRFPRTFFLASTRSPLAA